MHTVIYISIALLWILAAIVRSLRFAPNRLTTFELHRQAEQGDRAASAEIQLRKERLVLAALQTIIATLLIVSIALLLQALFDPRITFMYTLLAIIAVELLAHVRPFMELTNKLSARRLAFILKFAEASRPFLRLLTDRHQASYQAATFYSRDELLHMVEHDHGVLSANEQALIQRALTYRHLKIKDVMTPRASVMSLQKTDSLGPLILDSLHKSGQLHFPVVDKTIKNIVGVVSMADLLPLRPEAQHPTDVMTDKVFYIPENLPLDAVLLSFLKTSQHLFIVVNELEETTGVISIETILQQIIGSPDASEFEQYTDRRTVAGKRS
jgi:CBS domain containing-hemolysin-like protein